MIDVITATTDTLRKIAKPGAKFSKMETVGGTSKLKTYTVGRCITYESDPTIEFCELFYGGEYAGKMSMMTASKHVLNNP